VFDGYCLILIVPRHIGMAPIKLVAIANITKPKEIDYLKLYPSSSTNFIIVKPYFFCRKLKKNTRSLFAFL